MCCQYCIEDTIFQLSIISSNLYFDSFFDTLSLYYYFLPPNTSTKNTSGKDEVDLDDFPRGSHFTFSQTLLAWIGKVSGDSLTV